MGEKHFTFDVEHIANGYLIFHNSKKVYREHASKANEYIVSELKSGVMKHIVDCFPAGTAQRLEVTVGITGKAME